jgi:hypothetical protein
LFENIFVNLRVFGLPALPSLAVTIQLDMGKTAVFEPELDDRPHQATVLLVH